MSNFSKPSNGVQRGAAVQGTDIGSGAATSGYVLTADGSGGSAFAAAGGSSAATDLSNLASTAVNVSILPGTTIATDLGSATKVWRALFALLLRDNSGNVSIDLNNRRLTASGGSAIVLTYSSTTDLIVGNSITFNLADSSGNTFGQKANASTTPYSVTWPGAQGGSNSVLQNNGSGALSWGTLATLSALTSAANLATVGTITSGTWSATTIAADKGGTGQTAYTDGQLLIGNTATGGLSKATVTAGTGITVTNSNGAITIAASGGGGASAPITNWLVNGAFDFMQELTGSGLNVTIGSTASATTDKYGADQWYTSAVLRSSGSGGTVSFAPVAATTVGTTAQAVQVKIGSAPTANGNAGVNLFQTLENQDSVFLYNQTASFTIKIKATNNVTQVGVQFLYNTTETKVNNSSTAIGSEVLTTVNSSTFTSCTINGQALGTGMTATGVIGIRIRVTAVSTGNLYDINNGFVAEQAMLNLGSTAGSFMRRGSSLAEELRFCQRFYCMSFNYWAGADGPINGGGAIDCLSGSIAKSTGGSQVFVGVRFPVMMRSNAFQAGGNPTLTFYSLNNTSGNITDDSGADVVVTGTNGTLSNMGFNQIALSSAAIAAGNYRFMYVADKRI